jgi:hypothetical protein
VDQGERGDSGGELGEHAAMKRLSVDSQVEMNGRRDELVITDRCPLISAGRSVAGSAGLGRYEQQSKRSNFCTRPVPTAKP